MRRPLTFAWRNIVFGSDLDDPWALYRVSTQSYAGLSSAKKRDVLAALAGLAFSIEADFQILRVSREWSVDDYLTRAGATADARFAHLERLAGYLEHHRAELAARPAARPVVFIAIHLRPPRATVRDHLHSSFPDALVTLRRAVGLLDARGLSRRKLAEVRAKEERAFARVADFLDCERASTVDLEWLVRRAFTRALCEPELDEFWRPQALVIESDDEAGIPEARYVPIEADVLRLLDVPIAIQRRSLRIESEAGDSYQAFLMVGALPEVVSFPGRQAELLFAPLEAVGFPVDAFVSAEVIPNDAAVALARRKVVDADHAFHEESHGEHGPTANTATRPAAARELEEYLTASDRPPLLRTSIGICVSARSQDELDDRVERLRREFAPIALHRPLGSQLDLFVAHLPGQRTGLRSYEDILLCEQLGAMVPTATHAVGAEAGFYIGHTLSGSSQPVLFDLTEASRTSRPPAILCSGTLGSGKTLTAELLAYQGFLAGSRIVTVDPKGDHQLDALVGNEHVEVIELRPDPAHRGLLDPLRVGPPDTRADLAYAFLVDALPGPVPPTWQTEIRLAVDSAVAVGARTCAEVLDALAHGEGDARDAGRALRVHAAGGLLQLAMAEPDDDPVDPHAAQVTSLRIANLPLPLPGTPKSELTADERIGQALLRLLATYALQLMGSDWARHKVLLFDEAWMLLGDAAGRALVQRINRLCRSQNATPILATQVIADAAELENLIGAYFCFGVETDREAGRVLELLGLDAADRRLRSQAQGLRRGACFMRDYDGRVAPVQIDLVDRRLLAALDTTPGQRAAA